MELDYARLELVEREAHELKRIFPRLSTSRYVSGEGDNPRAMIIGEAPGAEEDVAGRPFVGKSGIVLRQLMEFADLYATDTYLGYADDDIGHSGDVTQEANCWLTNVCKFRPPRNGTPTDTEIKAFRPLLRQEWRAVGRPKLIIPVGAVALQAVMGKSISILKSAGKCHRYKDFYIWPMVHPSWGIRSGNAQLQELLEQDWINLGEWRRKWLI